MTFYLIAIMMQYALLPVAIYCPQPAVPAVLLLGQPGWNCQYHTAAVVAGHSRQLCSLHVFIGHVRLAPATGLHVSSLKEAK